MLLRLNFCWLVALLAEGVDRNRMRRKWFVDDFWSPSSRRAWIEITLMKYYRATPLVALLAEGVDRNVFEQAGFFVEFRRPPRGGRG